MSFLASEQQKDGLSMYTERLALGVCQKLNSCMLQASRLLFYLCLAGGLPRERVRPSWPGTEVPNRIKISSKISSKIRVLVSIINMYVYNYIYAVRVLLTFVIKNA